MNLRRSKIILDSVQFKSLNVCKKAAEGIDLIEEFTGIHSVRIVVMNSFVCPDINLDKLNKTPTEKLLSTILKDLR